MIRRRQHTVGIFGWVALTTVLVVAGCSESDDGGGGTPRPTNPPVSTSTAASTNTPRPTATATPTVAPADIAGDYAAIIDLDDGEQAYLNLAVASDGQASGTLEITGGTATSVRTNHALVAQTVAVSVGLVSLSGSINASTRSFYFAGTIAGPDGPIPFDISGTLPDSSGSSGSVALTVDGETYGSSIARGTGPTPLPTSAGATPTPSNGCTGGGGDATFSNVAGVNANQPLDALHLDEAEGNHSAIPAASYFALGGKGGNCPIPVNGVARLVSFSLSKGTDFVAGDSLPLGPIVIGQPIAKVDYSEASVGPTLQSWTAQSGTITVESVVGDSYRVRISDAQMVPGPPFIYGPPPLGTFTLNYTLTIDAIVRN